MNKEELVKIISDTFDKVWNKKIDAKKDLKIQSVVFELIEGLAPDTIFYIADAILVELDKEEPTVIIYGDVHNGKPLEELVKELMAMGSKVEIRENPIFTDDEVSILKKFAENIKLEQGQEIKPKIQTGSPEWIKSVRTEQRIKQLKEINIVPVKFKEKDCTDYGNREGTNIPTSFITNADEDEWNRTISIIKDNLLNDRTPQRIKQLLDNGYRSRILSTVPMFVNEVKNFAILPQHLEEYTEEKWTELMMLHGNIKKQVSREEQLIDLGFVYPKDDMDEMGLSYDKYEYWVSKEFINKFSEPEWEKYLQKIKVFIND